MGVEWGALWGHEQVGCRVGQCRSGLGNLEVSPLVVQDGGLLFPLSPCLQHEVEAVDELSLSRVVLSQ